MGKRVGLLGLLMVLALGTGVVADDATPVPSPWYAPDDLGYALPPTVAGIEMRINVFDVGYQPLHEDYDDAWRDVLVPLGKDPMDVQRATAMSMGDDRLVIIDMHSIDGVQAADVAEGVFAATWSESSMSESLVADVAWDWQDIAGRRVAEVTYRVVTGDIEANLTRYVYPKGEALFLISSGAFEGVEPVPIEDVLAELP